MRGKFINAKHEKRAEKQSGKTRVDVVVFQNLVEGQGREGQG